jgi:hypothetical protein
MGIIPVNLRPEYPSYCEIPRCPVRSLTRREKEDERARKKSNPSSQNKTKDKTSKSSIHSPNLLKPDNSPLSLIAITPHVHVNRTALSSNLLPLLKPALPSLSRLPGPPLAELMFALLTTCLSDGGSRSEAYTIDTFTVITKRPVDFVACDLRVLPGKAADICCGLAVIFWRWFDRV